MNPELETLDAGEGAEGPLIPETRGVRYRISERATPETIAADFAKIARHGLNTVIISVFAEGHTFFPCESLRRAKMPAIHPAFRKRDPLAEALIAAKDAGLRVLGHVEALHVGFDGSFRGGPILRRHPHWMMRRRFRRAVPEGNDARRCFLDPTILEARRLLGDIFTELLEGYPVSGVYLNDLRYPRGLSKPEAARFGRDLEAFLESKGLAVTRGAMTFAEDAPMFQEWQEWRNEQLNELLRYLHCRLERASSRVWIVSQAVGPYHPETFRKELQGDWGMWLSQQYVDAVAPLYKGLAPGEFRRAVGDDLGRLSDDRVLYPLLDPEDLRDGAPRMRILREMPPAGVIFRTFENFTDDDWKVLKEFFSRPARPVEENPYRSVLWALGECRRILSAKPDLVEFFNDLIKVLPAEPGRRGQVLEPKLASSIAGNLRSFEKGMTEGRIELSEAERPAARWLGVARRALALALRH